MYACMVRESAGVDGQTNVCMNGSVHALMDRLINLTANLYYSPPSFGKVFFLVQPPDSADNLLIVFRSAILGSCGRYSMLLSYGP